MPVKQSEAIILRTYPLREADLLVTFFTRAEGKVKGVAKSAKRSQKRFGGALEPLTCVRAQWEDRAGSELARLDSCDVLLSPLSEPIDYARCVALAHVGESLSRSNCLYGRCNQAAGVESREDMLRARRSDGRFRGGQSVFARLHEIAPSGRLCCLQSLTGCQVGKAQREDLVGLGERKRSRLVA